MKSLTQVGMGLVAIACLLVVESRGQQVINNGLLPRPATPLGQQPLPPDPGTRSKGPAQPIYQDSAAVDAQGVVPASTMPQDRAMTSPMPADNANSQANDTNQRHGELGVWLVETGRTGVRISRITPGSAAERAGLLAGDVILQVNGRDVSTPDATSQIVRAIPVGQKASIAYWRNGERQDIQVALQPSREPHQVGYRGGDDGSMSKDNKDNSDLAARTMRLEQQMESMTEELQKLRQDMSMMRSGAPTTPNSALGQPSVGLSSSNVGGAAANSSLTPSAATPPQAASGSAPAPAAGSSSAPSATSGATGSSNNTQDLFGTNPPTSSSPATDTNQK